MSDWKNTDPRIAIYKRADIIIVRPKTPGFDRPQATMATVETGHGYYIHTDFEEPYDRVGEGDDWATDWLWTFAPPSA